jgi:hypothetical protein
MKTSHKILWLFIIVSMILIITHKTLGYINLNDPIPDNIAGGGVNEGMRIIPSTNMLIIVNVSLASDFNNISLYDSSGQLLESIQFNLNGSTYYSFSTILNSSQYYDILAFTLSGVGTYGTISSPFPHTAIDLIYNCSIVGLACDGGYTRMINSIETIPEYTPPTNVYIDSPACNLNYTIGDGGIFINWTQSLSIYPVLYNVAYNTSTSSATIEYNINDTFYYWNDTFISLLGNVNNWYTLSVLSNDNVSQTITYKNCSINICNNYYEKKIYPCTDRIYQPIIILM